LLRVGVDGGDDVDWKERERDGSVINNVINGFIFIFMVGIGKSRKKSEL